jgi:hypothetical protein
MKFAKTAALAALLFGVIGSLRSAAAGPDPNKTPAAAIFVANNYDVTAYPLGSKGDVPPIALTTDMASPYGIARDSVGRIYVANSATNTITVYAANAAGNVSPIAVIGGSNTGLADPIGVALDATDKIYVLNGSANSVTTYAPLDAGRRSAASPPHWSILSASHWIPRTTFTWLMRSGKPSAKNQSRGTQAS